MQGGGPLRSALLRVVEQGQGVFTNHLGAARHGFHNPYGLAGRYPLGPDELIFTNELDEPIRRTRFSDVWRRAVTAAELPVGSTFHSLRHFYASLLIRHGESVKVAQDRLGHASAAETLDTYSHLWPDSEDTTRDAVQCVLGVGVVDDVAASRAP